VRNENELPLTFEGVFAHYESWKRAWGGASISYEYHFWRHQYYDLGGIALAKNVHNDVRFYYENAVSGVIEDSSQRSFFPNGLSMYVYAEALLDDSLAFETIVEDYFLHAYGQNRQQVRAVLQSISDACAYDWMEGEASEEPARGSRYAPKQAEKLDRLPALAAQLRNLVPCTATRPQTVSYQLLEHLADYIEGLHPILREVALGSYETADQLAKAFWADFGKREVAIERCYDHFLAVRAFKPFIPSAKVKPALQEG
jgi:hypothetical protein